MQAFHKQRLVQTTSEEQKNNHAAAEEEKTPPTFCKTGNRDERYLEFTSTMELMDDNRVYHSICSQSSTASLATTTPAVWDCRAPRIPRLIHPEDIVDDDEEGTSRDSFTTPRHASPLHHQAVTEDSCSSHFRRTTFGESQTARQPAAQALADKKDIWKKRGLTLSAFCRPENAIRLTQADPLRKLESTYDLHVPGKSGVLGHGAFSTVRLAVRSSDGEQVAVKSIAKYEALRSRRLRRAHGKSKCYLEEWEILERLQGHPNVVNLLDVFETSDEIQLVTEYCPGGELFDAIHKTQTFGSKCKRGNSKIDESKAAQITRQILEALADVHAAGIVHRDVKPENILLADSGDAVHVKLCDFGVARPLMFPQEGGEAAGTLCVTDGEASPLTPGSRIQSFSAIGSDYYAAPELAFGGPYGAAVDVFSLGVTLYILLCGFPPIFANNTLSRADDDASDEELFDEVLFPDTYWGDVSDSAKNLLRKLLDPDAALRVTAKNALQDPWLQTTSSLPSRKRQGSVVDLDLVRDRLNQSLESKNIHIKTPTLAHKKSYSTPTRKRSRCNTTPLRRRMERRSSTLIALADLCRTTPSVFSTAVVAPEPPPQERRGSAVATLSF